MFLGALVKLLGGGAEQGAGTIAWLVLPAALLTVVLVHLAYAAKQWGDPSQEKPVGAGEALDAETARTRARIAEKTQLADS